MTVTLVCDPSEAKELCASQRLYLKPVAKLTISVMLPEHTGSTRAFSKWEVMDKLKTMVCPDQFTSVKVSKSTKGFIRFEGEAESKRLVCSLKEKLHGKMIKLNGCKDDLQVVAVESSPDFSTTQELEPILNDSKLLDKEFADQNEDSPDCMHLEGLPCKWFALRGSDSETPSEDVLRTAFESFGTIKNVDIPMLDPYREEVMGGNVNNFTFRGLRTFDAYVQYQESAAFAKAMETLKGMKLMFKGDDGKSLACNIKVTPDIANHFSESAIKQRNLERLTLQGLERERKREENRGKKGTERKRRDDGDDEKKVGEGKRKSKIKRREKRQIDRDEKRPRKQQKVTAGEELWPENMPEWEARKYLLAQRRVESIRLLTVLLSQIKDVVLSSRQIGEPLLDLEDERDNCFPASKVQNALKLKTGSHYLGHEELEEEGESKFKSAQLDHVLIGWEEQPVVIDFPASPRHLVRTVLNEPTARAISSHLTGKDTDYCHDGDLLQVTVTQDCKVIKSPDRGNCPHPNLGCVSRVSNTDKRKKQKVYETEEFIHYLLNYYQTPRYARICPRLQNMVTESWSQRVVSHNGNGFQVNLENRDEQCITEVNFVPKFSDRDSKGDDGCKWEAIGEESEHLEFVLENQTGNRKFTKKHQVHLGESLAEVVGTRHDDELNSPFLVSSSSTCDKKSQEENTRMEVIPAHKSFSRMCKLKDLLEEISSDSEYFSEALTESRSKTERRNGGCRSSCASWPLSRERARELLICVQNVARDDQDGEHNKRSFCSNVACCDLRKHPRQKVKMVFKNSSSKVRHERQKIKWPSSEEEREAGRMKKKKKKRSSDHSLPDNEPRKTNHCGELELLNKMQRKCSKTFHPKMKSKTVHAVARAVVAKDCFHLQGGHQETGDLLLRREVEADSEGWPLFPVEIIETNPYPESVCGAEHGRGC